MEFVKVKDHKDLVRDPRSDQIINTNLGEYEQYIARRKKRLDEKEKQKTAELDLNNMKSDLDDLKSEIGEIKSLLKELVTNVN